MNRLIHFFLVVVVMFGCSPEDDLGKLKKPSWDPEVAVPLFTTRVTTEDLLNNGLMVEDETGFLTLVYRDDAFTTRGKDLIDFPDLQFGGNFTFPPLAISDFVLTKELSLGEIAKKINEPARSDILDNNGNTKNFTNVPLNDAGKHAYKADADFNTLKLISGKLKLTIKNSFPIELEGLQIKLINKNDASTIATFNYPYIGANGDSLSDEVDISGRTISRNLEIEVPYVSSPGTSSPVLIDTSENLMFRFEGTDIVAGSGTSIIPAQMRPAGKDTFSFNFNNGEELRTLKLKSGTAVYKKVYSDFSNNLDVRMKLPYVTKNGVPFEKQFDINGTSQSFDLSGYTFDFTAGGSKVNTAIIEYNLTLGKQLITFTAGDSLNFEFTVENPELSYAEGYLGMQTIELNEDTIALDIFKNMLSGAVHLEEPKFSLIVKNSYGIPISATIDKLSTHNSNTNKTESLNYTGPQPIAFNYPSVPGQSATTTILIDNKNSNISKVLSNSADKLYYKFGAKSNAGGITGTPNFITDSSYVSVAVNVEVPMYGQINNLVVSDTLSIELTNLHNREYADFKLFTENSFPVDLNLQLYFTDENFTILDSMWASPVKLLSSGMLDNAGRVIGPGREQISINFGRDRLLKLETAKNIIMKARFQSPENQASNNNIKLYSDYYINVSLSVKTQVGM